MSEFNFGITYRPDRRGGKPDTLTRRPGYIQKGVDDDRIQHQVQTILTPDRVDRAIQDDLRVIELNIGCSNSIN